MSRGKCTSVAVLSSTFLYLAELSAEPVGIVTGSDRNRRKNDKMLRGVGEDQGGRSVDYQCSPDGVEFSVLGAHELLLH
jgi:hypothetical protein